MYEYSTIPVRVHPVERKTGCLPHVNLLCRIYGERIRRLSQRTTFMQGIMKSFDTETVCQARAHAITALYMRKTKLVITKSPVLSPLSAQNRHTPHAGPSTRLGKSLAGTKRKTTMSRSANSSTTPNTADPTGRCSLRVHFGFLERSLL